MAAERPRFPAPTALARDPHLLLLFCHPKRHRSRRGKRMVTAITTGGSGHDVIEVDGLPALVMPLIAGGAPKRPASPTASTAAPCRSCSPRWPRPHSSAAWSTCRRSWSTGPTPSTPRAADEYRAVVAALADDRVPDGVRTMPRLNADLRWTLQPVAVREGA